MQTTEEKVDMSKALDANIRPIYDEEPMAEVQTTAEINIFAIGQQHTEQPEFNNEGEVVQNAEECHDTFVRQPTSFKSERPRISKARCDSQVDVHNDLSKPVTIHYLPKEGEASSVKPHHMIAPSNPRISSKNMTRFSSNDMVYNHYLEDAKTRTQERSRNLEPNLLPSARSQSTTNGRKPMPRRNTQTSRIWPASKNSFVMTKTMPIAEHPRNSRNDSCVTEFLKEGFKEFSSDVQAMTSDHNSSELEIHDHNNELSSSKLVLNIVPPADKTATTRQALELLFHHHITMLRSTCN
nr:hypothetical protein [Tanacetum cinerariifolium]